jgi:hypothetical protein
MGETRPVIWSRHVSFAGVVQTALAAGSLTGSAPGDSIPERKGPEFVVHLSGFESELVDRARDGTVPIRWSAAWSAWLSDPARCDALWRSAPVATVPGWPGVTMHSDAAPGEPVIARTCSEWKAAQADGRYAASSKDMQDEIRFAFIDGLLAARALARPAARTRFADFDLAGNARHMLYAPANGLGEAASPSEHRPQWSIEGNRIRWSDAQWFHWVEPVLFGDIDGDGWEDMLVLEAQGATGGTFRTGGFAVYSWIGEGDMVETTHRIPRSSVRGLPSEPGMARAQVDGRMAPLHPFTLQGTCACGGSEHRAEFTLEFDAGMVSGSARCGAQPEWTPVRGCLARETGLVRTQTADGRQGRVWNFDWTLSDGQLVMDGFVGFESSMEDHEFTARGTVFTDDERMRMEGWTSELRFDVADSRLILRRGCGHLVNARPSDVLCLESADAVVELARLDRIEWGCAARQPESDPATDAEIVQGLLRSVFRTPCGDDMLLLDGWSYGAATNNPMVIAVPLRAGRLFPGELQVFSLATIERKDGIASIMTHDLRGGADPYRDEPLDPSVEWNWQGRAWSPR